MRKSILVTALGLCAAGSFAALTTTGPFVGSSSEDFESFLNYTQSGGGNTVLPVFGGAGSFVSNGGAQAWIYSPANGATWGLLGNGSAIVHGGVNGGGLYNNGAAIDIDLIFVNAVSSFGGYFADVDGAPASLTFFDANGNNLGSDTVIHPGNSMDWRGWAASEGIKMVHFSGGEAPVMDDLQINGSAVPEPASMTALGLGALALIRRRRAK